MVSPADEGKWTKKMFFSLPMRPESVSSHVGAAAAQSARVTRSGIRRDIWLGERQGGMAPGRRFGSADGGVGDLVRDGGRRRFCNTTAHRAT